MKKFQLLLILLLCMFIAKGQSPGSFKYQAVARDASGTVIASTAVEIKIKILQGSETGISVCEEIFSPTTNAYGLVTLEIGSVNPDDFGAINWANGPYFIQVWLNGSKMGTSQLVSVPYAIHATTADSLTNPVTETDPLFSAWNKSSGITITESQISDLDHFTNADETDQVYSADSAYLKSHLRSWNTSLSKNITSADTTRWGKAETDPLYAADSAFVKSGTRSWNNSLAKTIDASDTARWGATEADPLFNASIAKGITAADTAKWNKNSSSSGSVGSESDPVFSSWDRTSGITIVESQVTNLKHFKNSDETDQKYAADSSFIKSGVRSWNSSLAKTIDSADTTRWGAAETDPAFSSWDRSSGITITESQVTNLKHFKNSDETDQVYAADSSFIKSGVRSWNSSLAKTIDSSDTTRWGAAETDPEFTSWDKSSGITIAESQVTNLKHFKNTDETDQKYAADSSFIKTGVRSWNSSLAKNITSTDTAYWNDKTYISDSDGDTKIETEQATDEDVIRMKVAGDERMSINNSTGAVLQLPTDDDNSSFKVKNSNGNVVFGVDGRGLMNGDGSGLSNVRPLIAYAGGNSDVIITSYNPYDPTLVKYVEITVPGPGVILTQATGYIQWKSKNDDYCRMSIISNDVATNTANFGSNYFSYLMLSGDHNLADSIDEYNNFSYSRVFTVSAAGTYRYNLWADKAYEKCYIQIADANMQLIYFPTGGTGELTLKSASSGIKNSDSDYDPLIPRNLDGTVITGTTSKEETSYSLSSDKVMILEEKLTQQQEEIDSLKKTLDQLLLSRIKRKLK
jgi:hypothetical protein